jgi:uncharacterized protein YfbU (UPF0304 family)
MKMQYSKMINLIEEAKKAGNETTEHVTQILGETFETWLDMKQLGELNDEEYDRLKLAFEEGYGICIHHSE